MPVITINVQTRSGRDVCPGGIRISDDVPTEKLMEALWDEKMRAAKYHPHRQRLTLPPAPGQRSGKALALGKPLSFYDLKDGSIVQYKDLGLQVGYQTVFFWEYLGPMLIYPLFWSKFGRNLIHGIDPDVQPTLLVQDLACIYFCLHFAKRIWETFHVHKFSHATMPIFNLFRNCAYYWTFAAFVSYFINHPLYTPPELYQTAIAIGLAYACQVGNAISHLTLANLRPQGSSTGYVIPRGHLFNYVTCANYTFEIWGWICFSVATQSLPAAIFMACGAGQMVEWAIAKHTRLRKLFDGKEGREKYPRRWIILPPIL